MGRSVILLDYSVFSIQSIVLLYRDIELPDLNPGFLPR